MATLEALYESLERAALALDKAAFQIRDLPLDPARENIRRIGKTLSEIFAIQRQIYPLRPELIPEHLWGLQNGDPGPALIVEGAFRRAKAAAAIGDRSRAIDVLEFLLRCQPKGTHVKRVRAQISKLRKKS